jgi:hypothetical protein
VVFDNVSGDKVHSDISASAITLDSLAD